MSATSGEFAEVLGGEVYVDVSKLSDYARHGIPFDVRGQVWMYLLGVLPADRSKEISDIREKYLDYLHLEKENHEIAKRIRGEISRYERRLAMQPNPNIPFSNLPRSRVGAPSHLTPHSIPTNNHFHYHTSRYSSSAESTGTDYATERSTSPIQLASSASSLSSTSPTRSGERRETARIVSNNGAGSAIIEQSSGEPNIVSNVSVHPLLQDDYVSIGERHTDGSIRDGVPTSMLARESVGSASVSDHGGSGKKRFNAICENVIGGFLNLHRDIEYSPGLVPMCAPFIYCLSRETEIFYCFEKLMEMMDEHNSVSSISERVASFITLFRTALPDLYNYFEEEEVEIQEWATSWLQNVLAREMRLDDLIRLWDTYFSLREGMFDLHRFVCLAVLVYLKESLEDMEQSEIRTLLMRLPPLDVDRIINDAFNLRHEHIEREYNDAYQHQQQQQQREMRE